MCMRMWPCDRIKYKICVNSNNNPDTRVGAIISISIGDKNSNASFSFINCNSLLITSVLGISGSLWDPITTWRA